VSGERPGGPKAGDQRMWGGRFAEATDALVQAFNASIDVDREMALEDLDGSIAHATMLGEQGIVTPPRPRRWSRACARSVPRSRPNEVAWSVALEDVHMNLERRLTERLGPVGGKLHTARSRNDQVATDFRLAVRARTHRLIALLRELRGVFVDLAERDVDVIVPGYTHLQVAQPVRLGHHWLAYFEMFVARPGAARGLARPPRRLAPRRRRAGRHRLPDRPPPHQRAAGLPRTGRQLARRRLGPRLRARVPRGRGDRDDAPVAPLRGADPVVERRSSASSSSPTRTPPAARSCRRRRTPTSPS
jgi:hypothetical protein